MATFSVDITDVVFAGTRTGYKDITITGMPEGGLTIFITGSNPTYFSCINNPDSKGTNVYRVSTKSTNTSSTGSDRTANLKITNKSDSTDYVTVSLKQYYTNNSSNGYISYNLSNYSDIYIRFSEKATLNSTARVFFPYSLSDSTERVEIYIDGIVGTVNTTQSWISTVKESAYTDTGFTRLLISCTNNNNGPRRGLVSTDYSSITIYQNGYPSSTSGCTQSISFTKSGGTESIVLNTSSSSTSLGDQYLSDFTSPTLNKIDNNNYSVTIGTNNTGSDLTGLVWFVDAKNNYIGHTIINQSAEGASLTISPNGASVGPAAGTTSVTVTSTGIDTVEYSIEEGWVSLKTQSSNVYTFSYTANTTSSRRSCIISFYGGGLSKSFVINQAAGAISVSPTSSNVGSTSGTVQVTVTGSSNITYTISSSWITYQSKSGNVYTFAYEQNSTSSQRTTTVTFSASGMTDGVFTIIQDAASAPASLTISPTSNTVISSSGSVQITVTSSGMIDVHYSISDNWITYGGKSGNVYTFNYSSKTSTGQRTGTIIFSGGGLSKTYTLTQEGMSADSITVNKNILSVVNGGEYADDRLIVTYTGKVTVSSSSWIKSIESSFNSQGSYNYKFNVDNNTETESGGTSELREGYIRFTGDNGTSCRVDVYQGGKTYGKRPVCIPDYTLGTYPAEGGQKYLVIDYNNKLTYTGVPSWITLNIVDGGTGATDSIDDFSPVIFSVEVGKNESSKPMEATMVFQGGDSLSLKKSSITVYQEIGFPPYKPGSLKAYPKKLRYYGEGGEIEVTFKNRPDGDIGYEIAYIDGSGWLSVRDSGAVKYVTATKNTGIRRRARIKFYDVNDISNYVIVPVIQGNIDGYDSIWMDNLYYPEDIDENGNYYYRIVDHNSNVELFRGISTIPPGWKGIGGIDIPRLVEGYLASYLLGSSTSDWVDMVDSYRTVDIYHMGNVAEATFKYCNDWSRFERRYDYTRSLNDPINGKGCDNMIIPFCVYYDDEATFSIVETDKNGNVNTTTLSTPSTPFAMRTNSFYDTNKVEYKQDDEVIFSYDMNHCGSGAFIYRNRFGGWDSFLIEGNIIKTDNYTKLNWRKKGEYNQRYSINTFKYIEEKVTDSVNIDTTYQAYTGWLSDEEAERLVFHLLSSPIVYFQDLDKENQLFNTDYYDYFLVRLTASSAEYKKFRNGKKMVNYLITFEKCNIEKVRY